MNQQTRFDIPPHTPNEAAVAIMNVCMHAAKSGNWTDAQILLAQFFNDAYRLGYQAKQAEEKPVTESLPQVQTTVDKTV